MLRKSVINIELSDDIEQSLALAYSSGFSMIELHSAWGKNIEMLELEELKRLHQLVEAQGLKVSCLSSTLFLRCFLDDRPEVAPEVRGLQSIVGKYDYHVKILQQAFRAAEILKTPLIRVFGFQKEKELCEETFNRAAEKFQALAEQAENAGMVLALENCPHTSFGWGVNATRLINLVDSPAFRLLWDPAGAVRAGEPDCIQSLPEILPLLVHVHAKDIMPTDNGAVKYLALGQGVVPWNVILRELLEKDYAGAVSIEPHYIGEDGSRIGAVIESKNAFDNIISEIM